MNSTCGLAITLVNDLSKALYVPISSGDSEAGMARSFMALCGYTFPPVTREENVRLFRIACSLCVDGLTAVGMLIRYRNMVMMNELTKVKMNLTTRYRLQSDLVPLFAMISDPDAAITSKGSVDLENIQGFCGAGMLAGVDDNGRYRIASNVYQMNTENQNQEVIIPAGTKSARMMWNQITRMIDIRVANPAVIDANAQVRVTRDAVTLLPGVWYNLYGEDIITIHGQGNHIGCVALEFSDVILNQVNYDNPWGLTTDEEVALSYIDERGQNVGNEVLEFYQDMTNNHDVRKEYASAPAGARGIWLRMFRDLIVLGGQLRLGVNP